MAGPVRDFIRKSRVVLYENGAVGLQYLNGSSPYSSQKATKKADSFPVRLFCFRCPSVIEQPEPHRVPHPAEAEGAAGLLARARPPEVDAASHRIGSAPATI